MNHINQKYLALIICLLLSFFDVNLIRTTDDKELVVIDIEDFRERNIKFGF